VRQRHDLIGCSETLADPGFLEGVTLEPERAKRATIEEVWVYLARGDAQNDIEIT